ncbi:MAG TPA: YihY/virulence factor BrkB family protein [Sphingomonas sp.]|nr:YihY/virulence factor BrkB family protein [Sphingomonas sp.]
MAVGVYSDGFIHAGNLAYLALISLFPFFIVLAALAHGVGHPDDIGNAIYSFLRTLPRSVRDLLREPIDDVLKQRTGGLLWLGALVGLWTTGSFIETIRDILRRAYGMRFSRPFWHYRLWSAGLIIGAVILMLIAFTVQLLLTGVANFLDRLVPGSEEIIGWIGWSRLAPLAALFASLYLVFYSLTPSKYRWSKCPKWPGAAFTTAWWAATTTILPPVLVLFGGYGRTYGSLAGFVVALFFFWLVGFGLVIGAHLNAALASTPKHSVREPGQAATTEE